MSIPIQIIIVEDRLADVELIVHALRKDGFEPKYKQVDSEAQFLVELEKPCDLILADWSLPQFSGMRALELMKEKGPELPFILVSGSIGEDAAVQLLRKGADDYIFKDRLARLGQAVQHALEDRQLREEKRRADEALRESEQRYRLISENAGDVIWVLDPQTLRFTYVSPSVEKLRGFTASEVMAQPMSAAVTPESLEKIHQLMPARVELFPLGPGEKLTSQTEIDQPCKDGSVVNTEVTTTVIRDETGKVSIIGVSRDVTARRLALEALRASEEKFRGVTEQSSDGIVLADEAGNIVEWNRQQQEIMGYEKCEVLGKPIWEAQYQVALPELQTPMLLEGINARITDMLRMRQSEAFGRTMENRIRRKDGTIRNIESVIYPIQVGELFMIGSITRDITDRKLAEKALSDSEAKYRTLYASMSEGVAQFKIIYDNAGKATDYECLDTNPAFDKLLGLENFESFGKRAFETHQRGYAPNLEIYARVAAGGEPTTFEAEFGELGKTFIISVFSPAKDRFATVFQDITERKQAEKTREESQLMFKALFELSPDAIILIDPSDVAGEWPIIDCNAAACAMNGYTREELIGKDIDILNQKQKTAKGHADYLKLIRQKGSYFLESTHKRKDGTVFPIEVSNRLIRIGERELLIGIDRDITGRKQVEQALRDSEERFRIVYENANDAILIENEKDEILSANTRACEMMGYKLEELLKLHVSDLQTPENRRKGRVLQRELEEHGASIFESTNVHASGRLIPVEISVGRIRHAGGDLFVSIVRDISERKKTEKELAKQSDELVRRNEELARLYRASGSLLSGGMMNTQDLAQQIVEVVQQEFGQDNCSLFMSNKDSNELERLATAGPYADQVRYARLTLDGDGLVAKAIRSGEPVNVADVREEPSYISNWEAARSELAVPLKIGSNVIGVIDVQSPEVNAFSPDAERPMTIFAERAALSLEHSRLITQTDARIQQLTALRTVDMAISGSFDINLTLGILLDQVIGQIGVDAADILIFNSGTQNFRLACERGFRTRVPQHTQLNLGMGYAWRAVRERRTISISSQQDDPKSLQKAPEMAGEQFTTYIGIPLVAKGQVRGVMEIFQREQFKLDADGLSFLDLLAGQAAIAIDNIELFEKLQSSNSELSMAYDSTLEGWANALELRDHETGGHTRRTTELTIQLAQAMGIKDIDIVHIYRGALLHDIGKMGVPDSIVLKPGVLTDEEWAIMRKHPGYAYDLLSPIAFLRQAVDIPYCHHEKWDGTGYPRRLKGEQIPLSARIFAVVDVWDALTSDRPYRGAWPKEKAITYIQEQSEKHFDPKVVEIFLREVRYD